MSSKGEFEDFEFDNNRNNGNMEEILDKVERFSIDWDNFDAPNNNHSELSKSAASDIFNKSKKSASKKSEKLDLQDSRDIMEISVVASQYQSSFRFEREDDREHPKPSERYSKLQGLLEAAKKNSLDQFYKNIDQQNRAYVQEPQKFNNYPQFKQFVRDLKKQKKQNEMSVADRDAVNPFASSGTNKQFGTFNSNNATAQVKKQEPERDFTKKVNNVVEIKSGGYLLPSSYADENFQQFDDKRFEDTNPAAKFHNFYEGGEKLPEKAPQHNREEDALQFFDFENKKNEKKDKENKKALQPIRQERHNSFEKTFQEEKLENLMKNYQNMRKQFESLMGDLKATNEGQEKIVGQLRRLKDQKYETNLQQQRRLLRQRKQKQMVQKNQKLDVIKDQIQKIKSSDKDILYTQINKKIEQLESVVKLALQEINEQKQLKIVPKVTNYFCEHENKISRQGRQFQDYKQSSRQDQSNHSQRSSHRRQDSQRSHNQSRQFFVEDLGKVQSRQQQIAQSPSQGSNLNKSQKSKAQKSPIHQSRRSLQSVKDNLYSPLDVALNNSFSQDYSNTSQQEQFTPAEFAQQHFPRQFQGYNKNLRNSLLQKSSVVFQSFDFHVSARFTVVDNPIHPIIVAMRIGNKCSIDLYDVHVIVYGPQGPGIVTDPASIFYEEVKKNTSFSFQVSVDKTCIEDNGFSIQISYKTDSMSKKKINFKVPLPLVQLVRPEFVYEQKFINDWYALPNQLFLRPRRLDPTYLRTHEDIKLILPFIELCEEDPDSFSYGIMFRYPKSENTFYMKITCYVTGKAALQLRSLKPGDRKIKEQILNVFNFVLFAP